MKAKQLAATYRRMRTQPLWKLLASDNAPYIVALLQSHLFDGEGRLPASILYERLERDLEDLRAEGIDMPSTAQEYSSDWLSSGYIERRFPAGKAEEEYELAPATEAAIRFLTSLIDRRTTATESRLSAVIQQLVRLAEETDTNPETRIAAIKAERERIDSQLRDVEEGRIKVLDDAQAVERAREIIALTDDLIGDFRSVRGDFEKLNRELRGSLLDNDQSRAQVLEALFAGVDLISESDSGRTFSAFWRLLTNPEQNSSVELATEQILTRDFSKKLSAAERRFLRQIMTALLEQGGVVHEVLQHFARNLKQFVESREYLEQRRLNQLLREAQRSALHIKDVVKPNQHLDYVLTLTSCHFDSLSRLRIFDPSLNTIDGSVTEAEGAEINLDSIGELVAQSEIDFSTLKRNVRAILQEQKKASIGDVMEKFPATQGLGSVVGYIALGSRHGVVVERQEYVSWRGADEHRRSARIPSIYFVRERINELV